ncbi:MAG: YHS domain-containing protein [Burkholderiales bacterium]|nr:YHS domain-containing protein [Burkholderiales bacterium]
MKHQHDELDFKDPVCGMEVSYKTAAEEFEYGGRMYYFCARVCREAFEAQPGKYIPDYHQHRLRHNPDIRS